MKLFVYSVKFYSGKINIKLRTIQWEWLIQSKYPRRFTNRCIWKFAFCGTALVHNIKVITQKFTYLNDFGDKGKIYRNTKNFNKFITISHRANSTFVILDLLSVK